MTKVMMVFDDDGDDDDGDDDDGGDDDNGGDDDGDDDGGGCVDTDVQGILASGCRDEAS